MGDGMAGRTKLTRCLACGGSVPEEAYFCIRCGAVLRPAARGPAVRPIGATGPTVRLRGALDAPAPGVPPPSPTPPARRPLREAAVPLVGLLFSVVFLI